MTSDATVSVQAARPWIWVDIDDTLWDFRGNSLQALHEVYVEFGLARFWPDEQGWMDDYHRTNDGLWRLYAAGDVTREYLRMERFRAPLTLAGCDDAEARRLSSAMDGVYLGKLARMSGTVEGAIPLLERLHAAGYNIGVLSNGFKEVQYGKMRSAGLDAYMDCIVLSDEIDINKPNRAIFDYACRKAGTTPDRCLMIGDNAETDILGAVRAGWAAVWFNPDGAAMPQPLADELAGGAGKAPDSADSGAPGPLVTVCRLDQIDTGAGVGNGLFGINIKKST